MAVLSIVNIQKNCTICRAHYLYFSLLPPNFTNVCYNRANAVFGSKRQLWMAWLYVLAPMHSTEFKNVPFHPSSLGVDGFSNGCCLFKLDIVPCFFRRLFHCGWGNSCTSYLTQVLLTRLLAPVYWCRLRHLHTAHRPAGIPVVGDRIQDTAFALQLTQW